MIELKNISKIYKHGDKKECILKNLSLQINRGDFVALTGLSGSGKSTLLNIIGMLDFSFEGEYQFKSRIISNLNDEQLSLLRNEEFGFIFQNFNLISSLTVLENVLLPVFYSKDSDVSKKEKKAKDLLIELKLDKQINKLPINLSGGEKQRTAIARALINDPSVILADEPTGSLDFSTGQIILNLLKNLHKKGNTIILVTHDRNIALSADKQVVLKNGKIVF